MLNSFLDTHVADELFSAESLTQAMLDFEAALALAQAECGVIPLEKANVIAGVRKASLLDVAAITKASSRAGSVAIPLVQQLTESVALFDKEAARYVHLGTTSQDVIDTAMALRTKLALEHLAVSLNKSISALTSLIQAHKSTPCLARTLLQPAQVISFGYKLMAWMEPLKRCQAGLAASAKTALCVQLGGAIGTRAVLGEQGDAVLLAMERRLDLAPGIGASLNSWHTQRDAWMRLAAELSIFCGVVGKVGQDLALLSQAEVAECAEPQAPGKGGSSAMPHKRNPVGAMLMIAAAGRAPHRMAALLSAMPQEHERGLGNWQLELAEWAALASTAVGASEVLSQTLDGLQVFPEAMLGNIRRLKGLIFAETVSTDLRPFLGKAESHVFVEKLCAKVGQTGDSLQEVLVEALKTHPEVVSKTTSLEREAMVARMFDLHRAIAPAMHQIRGV